MTAVISLPASLDEHTFEQVFADLAAIPAGSKVLVDGRKVRWASPFGLTALLCLPQSRPDDAMTFALPELHDTLSYWQRAGFVHHAASVYELLGEVPRQRAEHERNVLLEVTPITESDDVHAVVGRIQQKAADILHGQLHLDAAVTGAFGMTLSEACQNIVEHAGTGGWVAVQTYNYAKTLGRRVVQIAVCDAGVGFRRSLESTPAHRRSDRWGDATALEDAVVRAHSRFRHGDAGRGQGLAGIRRFIGRWNGKMSVRSGTARIVIAQGWDDDAPMTEGLAAFPGAQMQILIPERLESEVPARPRGAAASARNRGTR